MNFGYVHLLFVLVFLTVEASTEGDDYHNNTELAKFLADFSQIPDGLYKRLYSIGKSKLGTELYVVEVSATEERRIGVPNIKLIANIHGNEAVGREMLVNFLKLLSASHRTDRRIQYLLNNTRIHVMPTLNPDGFAISNRDICTGGVGRGNGRKGLDLNRNFPDFYQKNRAKTQPETAAVMKWLKETPFILSASLHGGALVANYPFDTVKEKTSELIPPESRTADNDVFVHLAKTYATNHATMHLGQPCPKGGKSFEGGITNGAAWYSLAGGMSDYNYMKGCMEVTLEISCCKYPEAKELPKMWEENREALLEYCMQAHMGVTGIILDQITKRPIANASLKIEGRDMVFHSTNTGEFWRLLLPGKYNLLVQKAGYYSQYASFQVEAKPQGGFPSLTNLTVYLLDSSIPTTVASTTIISATLHTTDKFFASGNPLASTKQRAGEPENNEEAQHGEEKPLISASAYHYSRSSSTVSSSNYFSYYIVMVLAFVSSLTIFVS